MTMQMETFEHTIGDRECAACWRDFPRPCGDGCAGLVHAEFGDENRDGDYWLRFRCDVCGDTGRPFDDE